MNYSRRKFLGGAGGIVSLPLFESLLPRKLWAEGAGEKPKRFVVYYVPNGRNQETFRPKQSGRDFALPTALEPFTPLREYLSVISGLNSQPAALSGTCDHAKSAGPSLTGMPILDGGKLNNGISIDQFIVQSSKTKSQIPSLQWSAADPGVGDCGASTMYTQVISWANANTPLSPLATPMAAFNQLFAGFDANATEAQKALRLATQKSVLDFVKNDAKSLSAHMNSADKAKLDEYLTGVREIEVRINSDSSSLCSSHAVAPSLFYDHQAKVTAFNDLMVLALRCDMTRVITFMLEFELSYRVYDFLFPGQPSAGHHSLSHYGDQRGLDQLIAVETWESKQCLDLAQKLKNIPEGDGNILDNTMLLLLPGMGQGAAHNHVDISMAILGKAGGKIKPGMHLNFATNAPYANLHVTLLNAMGIPTEKFGYDGTKILPGLLT
ncbi:MAG: DUF1552 domain-containing protein [Oligoflexus sp.]|nr:DUF1552 domain-containing protein [Oligoflexus sp.]